MCKIIRIKNATRGNCQYGCLKILRSHNIKAFYKEINLIERFENNYKKKRFSIHLGAFR